jgi:hypothetical protein
MHYEQIKKEVTTAISDIITTLLVINVDVGLTRVLALQTV